MTFKQTVHRHHEAGDAGVALLHLLYCEDAPGKRPVRSQSHLTLVYQRRHDEWVVVQDQHSPI